MTGFMTPLLWIVVVGAIVTSYVGTYSKGYFDGRSAYKAKIEREIANAVKTGNVARERALRDFDASPDGLPDDGFRRD